MKKGPLEFKQPKFWEERDGGLIPPIARFQLRSAGSKFKGDRWRGAAPVNSHREIGDLACIQHMARRLRMARHHDSI
jgi:hypothetical protein